MINNNFFRHLKPLEFYTTASIANSYGGTTLFHIRDAVKCIFSYYGYDFYILSRGEKKHTITSKGYHLFREDETEPDEVGKNYPIDFVFKEGDNRIWVKVDEYPEKFVATIMYPEDY